MLTLRICILLLLSLLGPALALAAPARELAGVVSKVVDGDSLWFTPTGQPPIEVRLRQIDAPELCQPWGEQARQALSELALGKPALLRPGARDTYGRTLGAVIVDEVDLGPHLVEQGHAWSARTRWDQGPLVKQERVAKALGRGYHATAGAQAPWLFRTAHGPCGGAARGSSASSTVPTAVVPPAAFKPAAAAAAPSRCDGRTRCTQMTSCAEARYFLANCPNVQMDGDHDGVPCEQQWCR